MIMNAETNTIDKLREINLTMFTCRPQPLEQFSQPHLLRWYGEGPRRAWLDGWGFFYLWYFCEFLHFYLLQHWYMICFILDFTFIFVHFYIFIFYNIDTGQVPFKFQGFTTFTLFIRFIYAYLNLFIFYNVDKERALKNLIMWLLVYSIGRHQVWNSVLISIALISHIPITKLINK